MFHPRNALAWILAAVLSPGSNLLAQEATVVVSGQFVYFNGVPYPLTGVTPDDGGGGGLDPALDMAVAIDGAVVGGTDDALGNWLSYGPWTYAATSGGWITDPGNLIPVGWTWVDNRLVAGDMTIKMTISCKKEYKISSLLGIQASILNLNIGGEIVKSKEWSIEFTGEVPAGVRKQFIAEAAARQISTLFVRRVLLLGVFVKHEEAWGVLESVDEHYVGVRAI